MYSTLQNDLDNLDYLLSLTKDKAAAYLNEINDRPVSINNVQVTIPINLPENGIGLEDTLKAFYEQHQDKIVASSGPRYWGFVTGGTTPAAIAGDWLSAVFDQNPQSLNGAGDVSANIELQTINWLIQLFGLPSYFKGGFVTGATMSNFTCLAVARQWAGKQKGIDIAREGIKTEIRILTATPHSSAIKSLAMLGLGSGNIITIKTAEGNREAMDTADLEAKLRESKDFPVIVISSGGTVNTVDFDDMQAIANLQKQYTFYWHIDAAFGAFAACSEKYAHLLNGWQFADSITVDCHKWLNVPYDSAIYLVQEKHSALQLQTFQNSNAPYLGDPATDFSFLNFGPENSRRLRALPAWFALQAYGRNGFGWIVENNINLANQFAQLLEEKTMFRLTAPVRLNVVCFSIPDEENRSGKLALILEKLKVSGKLFITPTSYKGVPCLRAAFVNWRTTEEDILIAIDELIKAS
ncbi:Glutamate or tyrosine decarboxylase [Mucilaginibacter sp. OK268]|uniref:pyridoxal phosphate-dependent decarboxylase family protein n=1 Tax=Mucilaginibacter sp. OK268 TaxID=1881048 RepID=UPI0008831E2D|nr:pyridoxal-dependent decarboxylase [Mucilaginibacter sp. OK268]SDP92393.1 Glutamate or tyrosine decarboxylase [Mucilaginibacter sp. OK268]